jgi:hypothetical protein
MANEHVKRWPISCHPEIAHESTIIYHDILRAARTQSTTPNTGKVMGKEERSLITGENANETPLWKTV